jgi:hypothetical protein
MALKLSTLKIAAQVSLVVVLLLIITSLVSIYQTYVQLVSPFIPASIVLHINHIFVEKALVSSFVLLAELGLYFFQKYIGVILLCILAMLFQWYPLSA